MKISEKAFLKKMLSRICERKMQEVAGVWRRKN
jgi:hypothetical protein